MTESVYLYSDSSENVLSVTEKYLQRPKGIRRLFLKPFETSLSWIDFFRGHTSETFKNTKTVLNRSNKFLSIPDYPEKVDKFFKSIKRFKKGFCHRDFLVAGESISRAMSISSKLIAPVADSLNVADETGLIDLSENQVKTINCLGLYSSFALSLFSFFGIGRSIHNLTHYPAGHPKFNYSILKIIQKIASLVLGILGIIHFFTVSSVVASWLLLSLSTTVLVASILKYYYGKIHESEIKDLPHYSIALFSEKRV